MVRKGQHLLLAQGYYHLPVKINSWYFLRDEKLKEKALAEASFFLPQEVVSERNIQDSEVPSLFAVLKGAGINVEREEDVDAYLNDQIDVVAEGIMKAPQDKQTALAEDISERWSKEGSFDDLKENKEGKTETNDWWMDEDSFSLSQDISQNPFEKH